MLCTSCGNPVLASSRFCPTCGSVIPQLTAQVPPPSAQQPQATRRPGMGIVKKVLLTLASLLVVLIAVGAFYSTTPEGAKAARTNSRTVFPVTANGKVGFIDATGTIVIEPQFDSVYWDESYASDGLARFTVKDRDDKTKWGYLRASGELGIKAKFDGADAFVKGFAVVKVDDKSAVIDRTGDYVLEPKFNDIRTFSEGLAVFCIGGSCGYADTNGNIVVNPQYVEAYPFEDGLAIVRSGQKRGFIDKTGAVVIPLEYDTADFFREGLARVSGWTLQYTDDHGYIKGGQAFIDKTGKQVIFVNASQALGFRDGLALVNVGPKNQDNKAEWGYVDREGKIVVEPQFGRASSFVNGLARASLPSGGSSESGYFGFIDKTGKWAIEPHFVAATDFLGRNGWGRRQQDWGEVGLH